MAHEYAFAMGRGGQPAGEKAKETEIAVDDGASLFVIIASSDTGGDMEKRFCGQCGNRHEPEDRFCRYCGCFLGAGASDKRTSSIYAPPKIAKSEALKIAEAHQLEALKEKMNQQKAKLEQDNQSDDKEIQLESEYQPISPDTQRIQKAINSAATLFVLSKMF